MKRITYQGEHMMTDDRAAAAILRYAQLLALHGKSDVVQVPAVERGGELVIVELLIGPASQLMSEPLHGYFDDVTIEADAFLADLHDRAERLNRDDAVEERFFTEG